MDSEPLLTQERNPVERAQVDLVPHVAQIYPNSGATAAATFKSEYNFYTSLLDVLQVDAPEVVQFLQGIGILSPWMVKSFNKSYFCFFAYSLMYLVVRITLPYFFIVSAVYFAKSQESTRMLVEYGILIDSLLFMQVAVLLPFLFYAIQDLQQIRKSEYFLNLELTAYKEFIPVCYIFASVFFFMIILDFIFKFRLSMENLLRVNLLEYVSICAISATLLFISTDCRMCLSLVESLIHKAKSNTLTMRELLQTRQEIDHRVQRHAATISLIVLVAVFNILYLFVFDIMFTHWTMRRLLELLPWKMASYAKEIVFLMILFNESAKLNERADYLVQTIANECEKSASQEEEGPDAEAATFRSEVQRLLLLAALTTKPISFRIAGRRWTKMDMLLQVVAVIVTTLIVVIRAIIMGYAW